MAEAKVQHTAISHPRQRASTWARNLDLADQTVPTPKYPVANCYLLVCLFIYFLSSFCCVFPTGQNALTGGSGGSSPGPLSALEQEGPHLGSIQLGFTSCLPLSVSHPESSGFTFNRSWCGLFRVFFIPLKHYSSSWCQNHSLYLKVLPGNPFPDIISQRFFLTLPVQ